MHGCPRAGSLSSLTQQRLGSQWVRSPAPPLAETPLRALHMTFVLPSVPHTPTTSLCSVFSPERVLESRPSSDSKQGPGGPQKGLAGGAAVGKLTWCVPPSLPPPSGHACLPVIVVPALTPRSCPSCVTGTCSTLRAARPAQLRETGRPGLQHAAGAGPVVERQSPPNDSSQGPVGPEDLGWVSQGKVRLTSGPELCQVTGDQVGSFWRGRGARGHQGQEAPLQPRWAQSGQESGWEATPVTRRLC